MAATPEFKVYNPSSEYIAACKFPEDAACLAALYGAGAKVKHGHSLLVWAEGSEAISAGESYDEAGRTMNERVLAANIRGLKRAGWSDAKIAEALGA